MLLMKLDFLKHGDKIVFVAGLSENKLNPQNMRRFWMMMCDYHGNIFNSSELGRALGLDHKTVKYYLDILAGTFIGLSM
jgi:predicted AAA+ superfamily ATPase